MYAMPLMLMPSFEAYAAAVPCFRGYAIDYATLPAAAADVI